MFYRKYHSWVPVLHQESLDATTSGPDADGSCWGWSSACCIDGYWTSSTMLIRSVSSWAGESSCIDCHSRCIWPSRIIPMSLETRGSARAAWSLRGLWRELAVLLLWQPSKLQNTRLPGIWKNWINFYNKDHYAGFHEVGWLSWFIDSQQLGRKTISHLYTPSPFQRMTRLHLKCMGIPIYRRSHRFHSSQTLYQTRTS